MGQRHGHFRGRALVAMILLIFGSALAKPDDASDDDLVQLARKQRNLGYDALSGQERAAFDDFFLNVHQGKLAIFGAKDSYKEDVSKGNSWGPERTIKAKWIMWLCRQPDAVKMVQFTGIQVARAKVDGQLDLSGIKIEFPLLIFACHFTDNINLEWSTIRDLLLHSSYVNGTLEGERSTIQGHVNLANSEATGGALFQQAKIGGFLNLYHARFPQRQISDKSIDLSFANIGEHLNLSYASGAGDIDLRNAEIRGTLTCYNANFLGVFIGDSMKVTGDVDFRFQSVSGAWIANSVIGRNFTCVGTQMFTSGSSKPSSDFAPLQATNATIDGDVFVNMDCVNSGLLSFFGAKVGGRFELRDSQSSQKVTLDLRDANVRLLANNEKAWPKPKNLRLEGFVFNELGGASLDPKKQIEWLRLQSRFVIQPYQQMATVFRSMGYEEESVKVSIAQKWDEGLVTVGSDLHVIAYAATHWQIWRLIGTALRLVVDVLWFFGFGWLIQYGYRPWNALFISIGFVLFGWMVFGKARMHYILAKKESSTFASGHRDRNFSAFIYSLETFVPLVKLGVAEYWRIDANRLALKALRFGPVTIRHPGIPVIWYYRIHIIAGWIFTSLWVAAFTGILKH